MRIWITTLPTLYVQTMESWPFEKSTRVLLHELKVMVASQNNILDDLLSSALLKETGIWTLLEKGFTDIGGGD